MGDDTMFMEMALLDLNQTFVAGETAPTDALNGDANAARRFEHRFASRN